MQRHSAAAGMPTASWLHPKPSPELSAQAYPWGVEEIGLFPLGIVLLPSERVPLHIFEPRYRELIGECIQLDREVGLLYADESGIRDPGTRARVAAILEQFDDGRINIVVEGLRRFAVERLTDGRPFMTAQVGDV